MKKLKLVLTAITIMSVTLPSWAAGPGSGSKTKYNVRIGNCSADSISVKYKLDSLMGEPTVAGSFKWSGSNCNLPSSTMIWLKVENSYGGRAYVKLDPVVPNANAGYGYNTTGSPNWNSALCGYSGTRARNCMGPSDAKELWKSGYVSDFSVAW